MNERDDAVEALSLPQQRYVEVIGEVLRKRGHARITDVSEAMCVSLPSVSEAVKRLVEQGVVERGADHGVALTVAGWSAADQLDRRHQVLKRFMVNVMAMAPKRANEVACRVEHCVDREFAERLLDLATFLEQECPSTLEDIAAFVRNRRSRSRESGE